MSDIKIQKITTANLTTLIKTALVGILSAEVFYLCRLVVLKLNEYIITNGYENRALVISLLCLLVVSPYLYYRDALSVFENIRKSGRRDLVIVFAIGVLISVVFHGIGSSKYELIVSILTINQLLILLSLPIIFGFALVLRIISEEPSEQSVSPFFISDLELKLKENDLLGFSERAESFAERVLNQGSSESMVFGIDAPWGIGKSTFVNFCKEAWEKKYGKQVIVYSFNPLRYEDRTNLLEKFVDGLVRTIQKNAFVPEIRPVMSRYSRFIKGAKGTFSFFGMNFEIVPGSYTIDDAFEDLESVLADFNKKVIIVVDDLDRLSLSSILDILFVIKKSFTLPNISYVLCYDTDNISVMENKKQDVEKITEFLEKFVNIKISIYLDSVALAKYVESNLQKVLSGNSQAKPLLISRAVGSLIDIYKSADYHHYLPFVGDVRKLKRLINTVLLFEIEKTDFDNSDFDNQDLIHLVLIYINYPNIFRKIYNTETGGKRGFFSVVMPFDDGYYTKDESRAPHARNETYRNSAFYNDYLKSLTENQGFLLNKVFSASYRLEGKPIDNVPERNRRIYACFNGGWTNGKNLEEYLNLIVKLSKPQKTGQYKFYLNCKDEVLAGKPIEEVLSKDEFSYSKIESNHEQFWNVITNSLSEFNNTIGAKLITYLMNSVPNYSLFTDKDVGVGLRDDLDFDLIVLLDQVGWGDKNGKHAHNSEENVAEIAEWIFGEKRHAGQGVLDILSKEDRGVLGIYDLLAFRLFCSADRGGNIFNLQRALSKRGDPKAPTEGVVRDIVIAEMRQISQFVFEIFKTQYIDPNKNLFDLIDGLSLAEVSGKYYPYIEQKISTGEIKDPENKLASLKSRMKAFITYQLGTDFISSGIGCGYYDPTGQADKAGIKEKINDYLFEVCFNKSEDKNYEHFVDYLLINFASVFASEDSRGYVPNISEFTKVLDRKRLADYWQANAVNIKALNLPEKDKKVVTGNYISIYKDDLPLVYNILDNLVQEIGEKSKPTSEPESLTGELVVEEYNG